ncbi:MAG: hypothetical protein JNL62_17125, partial [Bryobacterales bacterium]|nr:hypothetical protein [Bryobacterales bacterium]
MSPNQRIFFALLSFVFSIIPASMMIGASQTAPPVGKTGAPGDGTCAECHTGAADNPGTIVIDFGTLGYTPNQKQTIGVNIYRSRSPVLAGFQLTARLSTNGQAGFFEAGENTIVQVKDGVQYVSHKGPHIPDDQGFYDHFTFTWTPPGPGAGDVSFYAMAVVGAANAVPEGNVYRTMVKYRVAVNDIPPGYRRQTFVVPGAQWTAPRAIASNGVIAGSYSIGNRYGGFLRYPTGEIQTFTGPGTTLVTPTGVNARGAVVGRLNGVRAFVREQDGRMSDFTLPGAKSLDLTGISDGGILSGQYTADRVDDTLFTKAGETVREYSIRDSYNWSFGITSSGTPYSGRPAEKFAYVHLADGSIQGISKLCRANGVMSMRLNDYGMAVGTCGFEADDNPGFISAETGRIISLPNSRNSGPDGFSPTDVSNTGQIVGVTKGSQGIILTPCEARPVQTSFRVSWGPVQLTIPIESVYPDCRPNVLADFTETFHPAGSVTLRIPENGLSSEVVRKYWVAGREVAVTQEARPCTAPSLFRPELIPSTANEFSVTVSVSIGCTEWTLRSDSSWLVPAVTQGVGYRQVSVRASANSGPVRVAMLNLNGVDYRIVQQGAEACVYTVKPDVARVPASGGPVTLQISSALGCPWGPLFPLNPYWVTLRGTAAAFPTGGAGTVTFDVAPNEYDLERRTTILSGTIVQDGAAASGVGLRFVPVKPCRVLDTRDASKGEMFGPPSLAGNVARDVPVTLSACGVSGIARAYSLQVTAYPSGPLGYLTLYPKGVARPLVSTLNSLHGRIVTNSAIVPAGDGGEISAFASGNTDVTVDVNGFFVERNSAYFPGARDFHPQTPCRLLDTRVLGAPMSTGVRLPIRLGACAGSVLYTGPTANVLNVTAIPNGPLESLSAYRPGSSALPGVVVSAPDGQVAAASVILETDDFFVLGDLVASQATHAVVDGSGYFSRVGPSSAALRFYPVTPCRV